MVVDQSNEEPGRVRVKAKAGGGEYCAVESIGLVTAIAALGDETAAAARVCGEFPFTAEQRETFCYNVQRSIGVAQ